MQTWRYFPKCISDAVRIFPLLIMMKYFFSDVLFIQLSVFYLLTLYKHFFLHIFSSKNDMSKWPEQSVRCKTDRDNVQCFNTRQKEDLKFSWEPKPADQVQWSSPGAENMKKGLEICRELKERTHKHNFVQSVCCFIFFLHLNNSRHWHALL